MILTNVQDVVIVQRLALSLLKANLIKELVIETLYIAPMPKQCLELSQLVKKTNPLVPTLVQPVLTPTDMYP